MEIWTVLIIAVKYGSRLKRNDKKLACGNFAVAVSKFFICESFNVEKVDVL